MKLQRHKLKALSEAILELYRPQPKGEFPQHLVEVLARALSTDQLVTYNELPTPARPELVVVANLKTDFAAPYYPAFERHMLENPLIPLLFKDRNVPATRLSDLISRKEFLSTNIYNEYYRRVELDAQMACGFVEDSRAIGITVSRKGADFKSEELEFFSLLVPHLRQSFDLSQALEAATRVSEAAAHLARLGGWGSIGFGDDERILFVSSFAEQLAEVYFRCRPRAGQVLPEVLRDCVKAIKGNHSAEVHSVRRPLTLHHANGQMLVVRYAHDVGRSRHLLVFEQPARLSSPLELRPLGLSRREMDVVYWAVQNKTNWEIGKILGISAKTTEKHMENVFKKLGLTSRLQLFAKVQECLVDII